MRRWVMPWACVLLAAMPVHAQTNSGMTTGVRPPEPAPPAGPGLDGLTPAQRLEVLRIAEAERRRSGRSIDMDCGPKQAAKAMTDLERASWRLKCRK
jgi:hypothetical protein